MQNLTLNEKIQIYKNIFKGRKDIFAIRWEKADKSASGYTPVCKNEWKKSLCLKLKRGKCKDCGNRNYIPINENHIEQHLKGLKVYGIYPLLDDNASYFIAADFDNLDCLFLVYPFAFSGKLTQYISRIQRGNNREKYIIDYRDSQIDYLEKLFKKRLRYYKKHYDFILIDS